MRVVVCPSEHDTLRFGEELAALLVPDGVALLGGALGAGKTALAKGIAKGLGISPELVVSPTFTIVAEYQGTLGRLTHLDLYRLDGAEVEALAIEEILAAPGVVVVEWPDRLAGGWPGALEIEVQVDQRGDRHITVQGEGTQ